MIATAVGQEPALLTQPLDPGPGIGFVLLYPAQPGILTGWTGLDRLADFPAVFGGGIYDDIITRAGGVNPFAGKDGTELAEINAEALAAAEVDVLVIGLFQPNEDAELLANDLFAKFPGWRASKTRTFTSLSDGFYLGPLNTAAVRKIADAAHGKS